MSFTRFAIYYLPPEGALAQFGAAWLGWDVGTGTGMVQPAVEGIEEVTRTPRKYGFHATLKPPFRLAEGTTQAELERAAETLAASLPAARAESIGLSLLGRFLALTLEGDTRGVEQIAARCVTDLDRFRAPAGEAELARRRASGLSAAQDALLLRWGYPYVLAEFRFHMTLTGRLDDPAPWEATLAKALPPLPAPFRLDQIALVGEREDGRFELIHRYALSG